MSTAQQRAEKEIDKSAPPRLFSGKFMEFFSEQRGNVKVKIDHQVTERAASEYKKSIQTTLLSKSILDRQAQPIQLDNLARATAVGLCLSLAIKLINATPISKQPDVSYFHTFRDYQVRVPKSFLQVLDLVGKCEYGEWILRISNNSLAIRRLFLKALGYARQDPDFVRKYVHFANNNDLNAFNTLPLDYRLYGSIIFPDKNCVPELKRMADDWLRQQLSQDIIVNVGGNNVVFGYPQLEQDPTDQQVIAWLNKFVGAQHPNTPNIIGAGSLLLCNPTWLQNPNATLVQLDHATFNGTPVANMTPIGIMNAFNVHHQYEYINDAKFKEILDHCFEYYNSDMQPILHNVFTMLNQGVSAFGNIAQVVTIDDTFLRDYVGPVADGFPRKDVDSQCNEVQSFLQYNVADKVVLAGSLSVAEEVEMLPDYKAYHSVKFRVARASFFNTDQLIWSQQPQYN